MNKQTLLGFLTGICMLAVVVGLASTIAEAANQNALAATVLYVSSFGQALLIWGMINSLRAKPEK